MAFENKNLKKNLKLNISECDGLKKIKKVEFDFDIFKPAL